MDIARCHPTQPPPPPTTTTCLLFCSVIFLWWLFLAFCWCCLADKRAFSRLLVGYIVEEVHGFAPCVIQRTIYIYIYIYIRSKKGEVVLDDGGGSDLWRKCLSIDGRAGCRRWDEIPSVRTLLPTRSADLENAIRSADRPQHRALQKFSLHFDMDHLSFSSWKESLFVLTGR